MSRREHALRALTEAREELQSELSALDQAIATLGDDEPVTARSDEYKSNGHDATTMSLSIGTDKLEAVRKVLRSKHRLRQADITRLSKLNSGTVSVALRRLQDAGEVQATGTKEGGSMVWIENHQEAIAA